MKTLRQSAILLGALCSAAVLSAQPSPPVKIPAPGKIHGDFKPTPAATYILRQAMPPIPYDGTPDPAPFDGTVTWECYVEQQAGKLKNRASTWMVGTIQNPAGHALDVDLHVIGAQHRTALVWVRIVSKDPSVEITLVEDGGKGAKVVQKPTGTGPWSGFYAIHASLAKKVGANVQLDKRYRITGKDSGCVIEMFYDAHKPGSLVLQAEDGGPPAVPPVGEN